MKVLRCDRCGKEVEKFSFRIQISRLPITRCLDGTTTADVCQTCGEYALDSFEMVIGADT